MKEEWRRILESNGNYLVSNLGRVMNCMTGKILKPRLTKTGYARVHLPSGKTRRDFYIHRLVATYFCLHLYGNDIVNHIDNDPTNNRADNLEWTTQNNNVYHGMKQKRYLHNATPVVGYKDGKCYTFESAHKAEQETGCDHSAIIACCKGKHKHTHGYQWKYAEVVA